MQHRVFAVVVRGTLDLGPAPEVRETYFEPLPNGMSCAAKVQPMVKIEEVYNQTEKALDRCAADILAAVLDYFKVDCKTTEESFEARRALQEEIDEQLSVAVDVGRAYVMASVAGNKSARVYTENV